MKRFVTRLVDGLIRRLVVPHHKWIVAASLLVTAASVWAIVASWNINSDLKVLLPEDSQAARSMREVNERVGSSNSLFVVIDSPKMKANKEFARTFADELESMEAVSMAHFHNDKTFFEQHQLLYLKAETLADLREHIDDEIEEAKKKANPLFVSLNGDDEGNAKKGDDETDLDSIEEKYDEFAHAKHPEYFVSDDGYSLTIMVRFARSASDLKATNRLLDEIKELGRKLEPTSYHPKMTVDYGGALIDRKQKYSSILDDLQGSALFTILGLFLLLALYFWRARAVALVLTPLFMGVLWTVAGAFLWFGELNTISAFIFAILLGLGIDFSIHLLSGYDHARIDGHEPEEALRVAYQSTGRATAIGASTTFVTFAVVGFAQFRGLSQFGQMASAGVLLSLVAMFVVLPALILTFQGIWAYEPTRNVTRTTDETGWFRESIVEKTTPVALGIVVVASGLAVTQVSKVGFEENFHAFGSFEWPWKGAFKPKDTSPSPKKKAKKAGRSTARHVDRRATRVRKAIAPESFKPDRRQTTTKQKYSSAVEMQYSSAPTVLMFETATNAHRMYRLLKDRKEAGEFDTVRSIGGVYAFLPGTEAQQQKRLEEMQKIRTLLAEEDLSVLKKKKRERIEKLRDKLDVRKPVDIYDLPEWTQQLFEESGPNAKQSKQGGPAFEYVLYLTESIDYMKGAKAREYERQLEAAREVARERHDIEMTVGSQAFIYSTMLRQIKEEGPIMIGAALVLVVLILMVTFAHPLRGLVALVPLGLGSFWMFGIMGWLTFDIDFFNVIILPVVIGIGVDDGVHFYRRYLETGPGTVSSTLRWVGAAILMTSITSGLGFGGLAITDQSSLQSIGWLAVFGIGSAFLATVLAMPPLLKGAERYEALSWILPEETDAGDDPDRDDTDRDDDA